MEIPGFARALGRTDKTVLTHQFQYSYVYRYSSRDLPLHFLISSFWAGQEGTFLLWALYTAILGAVVMKTGKKFEAGVMTFVLLLQNFLIVILLIVVPARTPANQPNLIDALAAAANGPPASATPTTIEAGRVTTPPCFQSTFQN